MDASVDYFGDVNGNASKPSYNSQGYVNPTGNENKVSMKNVRNPLHRSDDLHAEIAWDDDMYNSQERFARGARDITVTTTVRVTGGQMNPKRQAQLKNTSG
ncbi:hypothetical protein N0V90_009892 [Kalmusia sp. IMI 367209]|nr:hypothetical protein N0V90_009892 [Kalmusia sp. IMI 367209]